MVKSLIYHEMSFLGLIWVTLGRLLLRGTTKDYRVIWDILTPTVLVTLAGGLYALGLLIINQMLLRLMILAGSIAYLGYYWTASDTPLWGAIYTTAILMAANMIGMASLLLRNASFAVPRGFTDIYPNFAPLLPGDFRTLMHLGKRITLDKDTVLSREGTPQDKIYFIINGIPTVTKMGTSFPMAERIFVGEVAYLTGKGSAATTSVKAGTEVMVWDLKKLRKAEKQKPRIKLALDAVISQDLARKVALAVAPAAQQIKREQA